MPERNSYTLPETIKFTANKREEIKLPLSGYITHMNGILRLNVTTGAAPSPVEDAMARIITGATIEAAGAQMFFYVTDGRQWYYRNYSCYEGNLHDESDSLSKATTTADIRVYFPIHWGANVWDPFDRSVVVPARDLNNLIMTITWGGTGDLGTDITINSGEMTLTINELVPSPGETRADILPEGTLAPRFEPRIEDITSVAANLGLKIDVPVGAAMYTTDVMVVNSAGNRTNTDVSEIGIEWPKERKTPIRKDFLEWAYSNRLFRSTPATPTGITRISWADISGTPEGLDLSAAMEGDVKLGFTTTATGGKIHLLQYMLTPV